MQKEKSVGNISRYQRYRSHAKARRHVKTGAWEQSKENPELLKQFLSYYVQVDMALLCRLVHINEELGIVCFKSDDLALYLRPLQGANILVPLRAAQEP
ncbi:hypothetical protein A3D66_00855 [Candidatus Kaiserbacteria bacterium RIFCSPHIGHO2_02_FULL_50_9]|nr:MAG: hypothetical protein A2761_00915 [Candidatus Kaiserbacteria bacterium RIFCSPHIGHO2_01_FULL_51_33]OGG63475.1 MAG: hypothetical protein A3D66_00855 [Candidatus Kaiserbacteria bacterium RIFCSPHIGHO2_02_FULL_50_9]